MENTGILNTGLLSFLGPSGWIRVVLQCPVPAGCKQLQTFFGFANFYRCFIRGYSGVAALLHRLTSTKPLPLPVPSRPWSYIAMDFITWPPPSQGRTAILTVVYRFSKLAHAVALPKLPSAKGLALNICSTNGQVERYNQDLETTLRALCLKNPGSWASQLRWAEYADNALVTSSGYSLSRLPTATVALFPQNFNGHVGEGNRGDETVMGRFGVQDRNAEGQMVVDFAKRMEMAVVNTFFQKRQEHRVTYKSGGRSTQVDYILCRQKAYDRVLREELWYCMRTSGVAEKYVRVVQDMYERCKTVVRCAVGVTEEFKVEVGLHQGSALSPFLFALVMDRLTDEVRQESPWTMMFADDIVICSESREQVEENLESWRSALENRGMKLSRSKTEYMCVNERDPGGMVRLQEAEVKKVQDFKYLGSTVQSNGECGKEVKRRVQAGWNGWRKVSGVLCDKRVSARMKGKVFKTVVRPAMLFGLETVALKKRQEAELEVAELKMLRFSLGVTRMDRIRNEYIRGTAHVRCFGDKVREARLRWFGHVQRRNCEYIGRRMLRLELPGRRSRGRPKRRFMDVVREDMKLVGVSEEDAEDRVRWRHMIRCGDP
ncbi:hypothetical protein Q8A73_023706 [Channa argus]|nr:hypothetical protein Q8A73_023706 [Channa argus]